MLELNSLKKAIVSLETLLQKTSDDKFMSSLDDTTCYGLKAGVIQNFEFTYELCWKFMKRWLENSLGNTYVEGVTRRELFRLSVEHHLINDVDLWMDYHYARNEITHTYDRDKAEDVFAMAKIFLGDAKILLKNLEAHNA